MDVDGTARRRRVLATLLASLVTLERVELGHRERGCLDAAARTATLRAHLAGRIVALEERLAEAEADREH